MDARTIGQVLRNRVLFRWLPAVRPLVYQFYRQREEPVIVLGNQKSGTSAIAALLAEATGLSYDIDMAGLRVPEYAAIYAGRATLAETLHRRARIEMSRGLIKEPNLTFLCADLLAMHPRARIVFVLRDPRANIRSICNRLDIPGNLPALDTSDYPEITPMWEAILRNRWVGDPARQLNYVGRSAERWRMAAQLYQNFAGRAQLVRYEDFNRGKLAVIQRLATDLGLPIRKDVSKLVDVQYQPAGKPVTDFATFFGPANYATILKECHPATEALGYLGDA